MALKAQIVAAFATLRDLTGAVAVVNGDRTAQAMVRYANVVDWSERGTRNVTAGNVTAVYDDLGAVSLTQRITVAGLQVYVAGSPEIDTAGAIIRFPFSSLCPVE